ncbi:histidine phosphatase family protein [Nocardia sp. NPDC060256]|uniref:histidine phosphatase family protein n=1 Tax=unclassified Nocardia TaxID=2637762 RepID=UPI003668F6A5
MRSTLVLVRHAQPFIPQQGGPDDYERPLTDQGVAQPERLVDELIALPPCGIASSPYLRAVRTVEPLARVGDRRGLGIRSGAIYCIDFSSKGIRVLGPGLQ